MTSLKKHAALFDLDGVLIDSEKYYTVFWNDIEKVYPTGIDNYAYTIKGTTLDKILLHYDSDDIKADIVRRLAKFQDELPYELFPGAIEFLESLRRASIPIALVTSSEDRKMKLMFKQLPQMKTMFDFIIDGSMVTRSKPDPQGYLLAARHLDVAPENCCVFEDSIQGLKAGRAAGGRLVGVATTYGRDIVEPLADITIDRIGEMTLERFLSLWK